jgi:hypothetical protein
MLHLAQEKLSFTARGAKGFRRVLHLRGLTTRDVGAHPEVGVNASTVNQWLAASLMVTPETLEALAHAVGCASWAACVELGDKLEQLAELTLQQPPEAG